MDGEAVAVLPDVAVDIVATEDEARFRDLMQANHYLGAVPGKSADYGSGVAQSPAASRVGPPPLPHARSRQRRWASAGTATPGGDLRRE